MSVDKQNGEVIFTCDSCDESEYSGSKDFMEAKTYAQSYGWKFLKLNEDWHHFCSDFCMEQFKSEELDGDFDHG